MKKGFVVVVAFALMLLLSASMIAAQEKATCQKEMKIADEQKGKVEELKMNFRLKTIDLKAEQQKLGIMLKKEMMKPEPVMQDIEGIVKKMSAVREKLQLAGIEHMLAMRKLLGPDWRKLMRPGMGGCKEMMGGPGMKCAGDEKDVIVMRESMPGKREGCGMMGTRGMRMRTAGPDSKPGCSMERPGMAAMKGGCMMDKGQGMGEKGGCMMMQKGGKCSSHMSGKWHSKMFRPYGKKGCCSGMSGGMMHKGAMGAGGCMGGKTGKKGCSMSCTEKGAQKEIKCEVEIKEVKKR